MRQDGHLISGGTANPTVKGNEYFSLNINNMKMPGAVHV